MFVSIGKLSDRKEKRALCKGKDLRDIQDAGTMFVILTVHGGERELLSIMDAMVDRNARAITEGQIPGVSEASQLTRFQESPQWRDGPSAIVDGVASAGTIAAWQAADRKVRGDDGAHVALVGGIPRAVSVTGGTNERPSLIVLDDVTGMLAGAHAASVVGAAKQDKMVEYMVLRLDDGEGLPIREFGDAIARHNARRMVEKQYPKLYESGVRYQTEGAPEKWWDVDEALAQKHDDCEGLAAYRAAELILEGLDAHVHTRIVPKPDTRMGGGRGGRLFHAVTRVDTGHHGPVYDDPSARLGMPVPSGYKTYLKTHRD